jgi:hypothetical protein
MSSPLLPYANSYVLVTGEGEVSAVDGRIQAVEGNKYLVKAFMSRTQYSGVSSGSKKIPLESQLDGQMMPGGSGDQFYYRGYALQYAIVPSTFDLNTSIIGNFAYTIIKKQYEWLKPGIDVQFKFGDDPILFGQIERSSGIYGGIGIDEIIYKEIGGVQLQITGGELQG